MAETEILRSGSWRERRLHATGAVVLEVLSAVPGAALAVDGLQGSLRHHSPASGAFPLQAAVEGVVIVAAAPSGQAFPGGALADLSLTFPATGQSYLLQGIDVSGHGRAPLVELSAEGGQWVLTPGAGTAEGPGAQSASPLVSGRSEAADGGTAAPPGSSERAPADGGWPRAASASAHADARGSEILGSWLARRRAERGELRTPRISAVLVDDSASMRTHRDRASELMGLIRAYVDAAGGAAPEVRGLSVGGASRAGVGSSAMAAAAVASSADAEGPQAILITDLPTRSGGLPSLVIGDPAVASALLDGGEESLILSADAWLELEREDTDYDDATLRRLAPLMQWLEHPNLTKENAR